MFKIPARVEIGILVMFGFINLYMIRINLSVISVEMIKRNATSAPGQISSYCRDEDLNTVSNFINKSNYYLNTSNQDGTDNTEQTTFYETGELEWSQYQKGLALGSFFYGYSLTQIIGGRLAELYGSKLILLLAIGPNGILTILSPVVARTSYGAFIALRIVMGILSGPAFPALHCIATRWFPQFERSRFLAIAGLSTCIGIVITMPLCGAIASAFNWEAAFYVTGSIPLIWAVLWIILAKDDPKDHPRISKEELVYIKEELQTGGTEVVTISNKIVPWKDILMSLPFWAIILSNVGHSWGLNMFLTYLPTYLNNILNFSTSNSGMLSSLPFLVRYIGAISLSTLSDILISNKRISVLNGRRIFSAISLFTPGVMLILITIFGCDPVAVMSFLCLAMFFNGGISAGYFVNHTDLSPVYSGTLMGIDNTCGSFMSFLNPTLIGLILNQEDSIDQWRIVFLICVPMYIIPEVIYLFLVSTTIQPWNYAYKRNSEGNKEEREELASTGSQDIKDDEDSLDIINKY